MRTRQHPRALGTGDVGGLRDSLFREASLLPPCACALDPLVRPEVEKGLLELVRERGKVVIRSERLRGSEDCCAGGLVDMRDI